MGIYVPGKGIKRTKVTRDDGHVFETLNSVELARTIYTPEDGFTAVVEIFGHDADLDGPRVKVSDGEATAALLSALTPEELNELSARLCNGWVRAGKVYLTTYTNIPLPNGGYDSQSHQDPIVYDLEKTFTAVANESYGRHVGCRWQACEVCRHSSCAYCPACSPDVIAPNGGAYGDVEDAADEVSCCS